jgi:HD-like signal output (HDOD) protein
MAQEISVLIDKIMHDAGAQRLQLPSLPEVILQIQEAIEDDRKGLPYVARLIQADPGLCARLIKIANSPLYHNGVVLPDIRRAIARLGLQVTRDLVSCLIMHNVFNVQSTRLHRRIQQLWQHSCRVAAISQVLARLTPGLQPDRSLLAGLLHDIGVLPILVYADQFPTLAQAPEQLETVIAQLRASLGEQILRQWQLGDDLVIVPSAAEAWTREHAGPADYGDLVQVAQVHSYLGTVTDNEMPSLTQLPAFTKLSLSKLGPHAGIELLEQAQADINVTTRLLNG